MEMYKFLLDDVDTSTWCRSDSVSLKLHVSTIMLKKAMQNMFNIYMNLRKTIGGRNIRGYDVLMHAQSSR